MCEVDLWFDGVVVVPWGMRSWDIENVFIGDVFYCAAVMELFRENVVV